MQKEIVDMKIGISNITADAINNIAYKIEKSPSQTASFLLSIGFSNLMKSRVSVNPKVLATYKERS